MITFSDAAFDSHVFAIWGHAFVGPANKVFKTLTVHEIVIIATFGFKFAETAIIVGSAGALNLSLSTLINILLLHDF